MKDIGEKLKEIHKMYQSTESLEYELERLIGRMVVNQNKEAGFISCFDFDNGKFLVEYGLRNTTDFRMRWCNSDDLINGNLKFE